MSNASSDLPTGLLKEVSRSFYLTMRILPSQIRRQISLAYLLARTTDTIADTEIIPVENRLDLLTKLGDRIRGKADKLNFSLFIEKQQSTAEKILLERHEDALQILSTFSKNDQQLVRDVLDIIISGQSLDLTRFRDASESHIISLKSDADLDDYTYRVAGCVGEFWTKICRAHLFPSFAIDEETLFTDAVRFGKGLQLVNILRDLPRDLRQGRCYLPEPALRAVGLSVPDLLLPTTEAAFRGIYDSYLQKAQDHLLAGWRYTLSLPRDQIRLRLSCAWPILLGHKTLEKLRIENPLDPQRRIKVTRREVRQILLRSIFYLPFRERWQNQMPLSNGRNSK